jgi:hypothetical protein
MRLRCGLLLGVVSLVTIALAPPLRGEELPPHPRLLLDAKDVEALKQRTAGPFAAQWKEYVATVDRALSEPVELPPRGGNWSHNYVCPEHGARLKRGKRVAKWEWEHTCPVGSHPLNGDPSKATTDFDGNGIASVHGDYSDLTTQLGVAYQVTREAHYAERAKQILLAYADAYLTYPLHDNQGRVGPNPGRAGHIASQSLTEASLLIGFVHGADLVWDTLSPDERTKIETKFFRPAIEEVVIPGDKKGPHNIQCRHNSAIGLVGFLVGDERLIKRAIDEPVNGFHDQLKAGVLEDGFWFEGAGGYHFFTIEGLWPLAEAARHCGMNLYDEPRFKKMFDVPLAMAMPDLRLPNFNDSGFVRLSERADAYELAYARWKDPTYLRLISTSDRKGKLALLYGVPELPVATEVATPLGSRNLAASGYAILQKGDGKDATWLSMKYGPHGGWHGHFDKNNFILYARGRIVMPDPGTHAYGSPLHKSWDRTSIAHNTLAIDGKSQAEAQGKCLAFGSERGVDFTMADAGEIAKDSGVRFVRTVGMIDPNLIVVVDDVRADRECTYDLAVHLDGKWSELPKGEPTETPAGDGYANIGDLTSRRADGNVTLGTDAALVTLAGGEATEIITGSGVGESTESRVPVAIFRRKAKATRYAWAVSLDGKPVALEHVRPPDTETSIVRVKQPDGYLVLLVQPVSGKVRVTKDPLP